MLDFRKNHIEWISIYFLAPLNEKNWVDILKYFNKKDRKLKSKSGSLNFEIDIEENIKTDYHIHLQLSKKYDKSKLIYPCILHFHEDPKNHKDISDKYKPIYFEQFFDWFITYFGHNTSKSVNFYFRIIFKYRLKTFSFISKSLIEKKQFDPNINFLGNPKLTSLNFEFNNSKIGLEELSITEEKEYIKLEQVYNEKLNYKDVPFTVNKFSSIGTKVSQVFIYKK